jgi:hypothetical protein
VTIRLLNIRFLKSAAHQKYDMDTEPGRSKPRSLIE